MNSDFDHASLGHGLSVLGGEAQQPNRQTTPFYGRGHYEASREFLIFLFAFTRIRETSLIQRYCFLRNNRVKKCPFSIREINKLGGPRSSVRKRNRQKNEPVFNQGGVNPNRVTAESRHGQFCMIADEGIVRYKSLRGRKSKCLGRRCHLVYQPAEVFCEPRRHIAQGSGIFSRTRLRSPCNGYASRWSNARFFSTGLR